MHIDFDTVYLGGSKFAQETRKTQTAHNSFFFGERNLPFWFSWRFGSCEDRRQNQSRSTAVIPAEPGVKNDWVDPNYISRFELSLLKERNFKEAFRFKDAIYSTKFCGKFDLKLSGSVWSNRKSFEKGGPPLPWSHRLSFNIIFFYLEICDAKRWSKRRAERKESLW